MAENYNNKKNNVGNCKVLCGLLRLVSRFSYNYDTTYS